MLVAGLVRVTRDPESREVGSSSVCKFTVVENKKRGGKEVSTFLDVEAWGKQGETIQNLVSKGTRLWLTADMEQQNWEKDGEKKSKMVARLSDFRFVDAKAKGEEGSGNESSEEPENTVF